jgi:hypothetical protein
MNYALTKWLITAKFWSKYFKEAHYQEEHMCRDGNIRLKIFLEKLCVQVGNQLQTVDKIQFHAFFKHGDKLLDSI